MKITCDNCKNEAVIQLTLSDMDGVVAHDAKLCRAHAEGLIQFHPTEKDEPLSILNI